MARIYTHATPFLRRGFLVAILSTAALAHFSLSCAQSSESPRAGQDKLSTIRRLLDEEYAKDGRGGFAFGLVERGKLTWTYCAGFAVEDSKRSATADDIYPIASATKMLTGLMLLQLVERGKVHLSDPVEKYVPEIGKMANPYPWAPPITLMQLATMTAGLQAGVSIPEDARSAVNAAPTWEEKFALVIPSLKFQYEPGTARHYSNAGYAILGLALSRAAKRAYEAYVAEEILKPLQMNDSAFFVPSAKEQRIVFGYVVNGSKMKPARAFNEPNMILEPAAGLLTTVGDLAKLMQFQLAGGAPRVLSDEMRKASYQLLVASDGDLKYGDGVGFAAVRDTGSHLTALGHGGAFPDGFVASYEFDLPSQTGVILLANTYGGRANYKPLMRKILFLLNPASSGGTGLPALEEH
ncbi:MAG TPA: serine hydrolase domain-containing protein [Steroidobacteraceae bacterium]|nr:serine hydrolase domain-containing protein [Steroidobacteraceae bacterium]